jgi:4-diphosphocytidyl-2-C-methyl-D-erythritol kinase
LPIFERLAPAKVNLFLHVGPVGADGYHPIASLMTFADVGDVVSLDLDGALELAVVGPFAGGLGTSAGNLVTRARDAAMAAFEVFDDTFSLTLDKRLPIAAGLGGGSADAAATLKLMAQALNFAWGEDDGDPLVDIAVRLGADVAACLEAQPVLALGRGDELDWPPPFPDLDVVLANPGASSPTGAVYRAYDALGAAGDDVPDFPDRLDGPEAMAEFLARCRNDLQAAAVSLAPAIGRTLEELKAEPETLLARMSGSGATSFAICRDARDAQALADRLARRHTDWWVRACRLKGFRP